MFKKPTKFSIFLMGFIACVIAFAVAIALTSNLLMGVFAKIKGEAKQNSDHIEASR